MSIVKLGDTLRRVADGVEFMITDVRWNMSGRCHECGSDVDTLRIEASNKLRGEHARIIGAQIGTEWEVVDDE